MYVQHVKVLVSTPSTLSNVQLGTIYNNPKNHKE